MRELVNSKKSLVLMFSVCDSAAKYWNLFTERKILGLRDEIDFRTSYVAIYDLDSKKLVERYNAKNDEIIYNCNIITKNSNYILSSDLNQEMVNYFSVLISSKAWEWSKITGEYKCWSRILINNIDYSRNKIGLNVVVFSKDEQCVVDSFNVNLHGDPQLMLLR